MHPRILLFVVSLVFTSLSIYLGYYVQRVDFQSFILAYTTLFGCYAWVLISQEKKFSTQQTRFLLGLGIALRVLLLFSIPLLSDDYARFLWDGHLTLAGIHPFAQPPVYYMDHLPLPPGLTTELFSKLNSPRYFTVYPPVCQAVFALSVWIAPKSEWAGVICMKAFLLVCELGAIYLLWALSVRSENSRRVPFSVLAYGLNPLILIEIMGNAHFEGAMIFFLLAGLWAFKQGRVVRGAFGWALSAASKMLPILFLPIICRCLGWRKGLFFGVVFGTICLLLFAPILPVLPHILESLNLYFQKFQFNASLYYLVREVGIIQTGWDIGAKSGPILGGLSILGLLIIAAFTQPMYAKPTPWKLSLESAILFALMIYLSFAATVQPWYAALPLAISLLTRWRFALLWTGLVMLSYSHYNGGARQENYPLIALEYLLVWGFFFWELSRINVRKAHVNSC